LKEWKREAKGSKQKERKKEVKPVSGVLHKAVAIIDAQDVDDNHNEDDNDDVDVDEAAALAL